MTLGPEKVQERLTRKPPPGRLLQHTPRRQPLQKLFSFSFADGISWNAKSTSSPSDTEEKRGKNSVNPSSVTLNPVALQCRISSMQPFNDTFSPLCPVISFTNPPNCPQKTGIERIFNGCFLSMTLSPLNASFPFGSSFEFCAMLVPPFTGRKCLCFQQCFLRGFTFLQSDKGFCFLPFFFSFHPCWLKIAEQYLLKQPKNSRSPKVLRCRKKPCGSPSL